MNKSILWALKPPYVSCIYKANLYYYLAYRNLFSFIYKSPSYRCIFDNLVFTYLTCIKF